MTVIKVITNDANDQCVVIEQNGDIWLVKRDNVPTVVRMESHALVTLALMTHQRTGE